MNRLQRTLVVAVILLSVLVAPFVFADAPRVVLVGSRPDQPTLVRVRDELRVLGFEVEVVSPPPGDVDLATLARRRNAAAAARVEDSPPDIIVWVDPAQSAVTAAGGAEIRVGEGLSGATDPSLLALRAIELLRGRLLPVAESDATTSTVPPDIEVTLQPQRVERIAREPRVPNAPPKRVLRRSERPASPARRQLAILAAPAVLISLGGVPITPHVRVGAAWRAMPVGIDAFASIPTIRATASVSDGAVSLRALFLGGGVNAATSMFADALELRVHAGAAAAGLFFSGKASAGGSDASGTRWAIAPYTGASASYRLTRALNVRGDVAAFLVRPEPVLRVSGREIATFGQPAVLLSIGAEVLP